MFFNTQMPDGILFHSSFGNFQSFFIGVSSLHCSFTYIKMRWVLVHFQNLNDRESEEQKNAEEKVDLISRVCNAGLCLNLKKIFLIFLLKPVKDPFR